MSGEVKKVDAAGWFLGGAGKKRPTPNLALPEGVTPATLDDVERLLDRAADDGKKLTAGLRLAVGALERIADAGFTPDLLVLMVLEKAPYPRGAKNPLNGQQVEAALKGLFAIGEFLR